MDLQAFWRVVAMVCGISVYQSDRRPGLVASQFLLYVIYNNYAERAFASKTAPKMRRKIRMEEVPCGFSFVVYYATLISLRKSSCCEKFTKITLNFLLSAFLIALLHFSVCVPVLPSAFSFCGKYLLLYPCYPLSNISFILCLTLFISSMQLISFKSHIVTILPIEPS